MEQGRDWFKLLKVEYQELLERSAKLKKIIEIYEGNESAENNAPILSSEEIMRVEKDASIDPTTYLAMAISIAKSDLKGKDLTSGKIADLIIAKEWKKPEERRQVVKQVSTTLSERTKDFIDTEKMDGKSKVYRLAEHHLAS